MKLIPLSQGIRISGDRWSAMRKGTTVTLVLNAQNGIFTLPEAFRPSENIHMVVTYNIAPFVGRLIINAASGAVTPPEEVPIYGTVTYQTL